MPSTRSTSSPPAALILLGTAARPVAGGVGLALGGHEYAARAVGVDVVRIETHHATGPVGKVAPWASSFGKLRLAIERGKARGAIPVVIAHAGAWPSIIRKRSLLLRARQLGARVGIQLHGSEVDGYLDSRTGRRFVRRALGYLDWVGVLTPWWQERLQGAGIPSEVLPNPITQGMEEAARQPFTDPDGPLRVAVLTRLVQGKGVGLAIDAASRAGVDLEIAGAGPRRRSLERQARSAGGGAIRFLGWVDGAARASLLRRCHLLCHPSTSDVFPMAPLEAMARARPVVAVRHRSTPDVIPHGVAGLLVEPQSAEDVARALVSLRDPDLRKQLGVGGQRWVLERYAPGVVGVQLASLIDRLVRRG